MTEVDVGETAQADDARDPRDPRVVHASPRAIQLVYAGSDLRNIIHRRGVVADGDWDRDRKSSFERTHVFAAIRDTVAGTPWDQTHFFRARLSRIEAGFPQFDCHTEAELRARGEYILRLYERIRAEGYRSQSQRGTPGSFDEVRVAIDRHGRLLFLDGRHRLTIAKLLGIDSIPVHIAQRHARWQAFRAAVHRVAQRQGGRLRQPVDHPDLAGLPSQQGTLRRDAIRWTLGREGITDGAVVDLNPGWGYHAGQLAADGLRSTAVVGESDARFARRFHRARTTPPIDLVEEPVESVAVERCDVLLAVDGPDWLRHDTPPAAAPVDLIRRLRPIVAIVEPQVPAGSKDADTAVTAAARSLAEATGMRLAGICGRGESGQPLFVLRRTTVRA